MIAGLTSSAGLAIGLTIVLLMDRILDDVPMVFAERSLLDALGALWNLSAGQLVRIGGMFAALGLALAMVFAGPSRLLEGQPEEDNRIDTVIRSVLPGGKDIIDVLEHVSGNPAHEHEIRTLSLFGRRTSARIAAHILEPLEYAERVHIIELAATGQVVELARAITALLPLERQRVALASVAEYTAREVGGR